MLAARWTHACLLAALPLALGCGAPADPFAESGESSGEGDGEAGEGGATTAADTAGDGDSGDGDGAAKDCPQPAHRYIVLGDSVPQGVGVGGKDDDRNGFKMLHGYIQDNYAADGTSVTYENYAVGGAVTSDVPNDQLGVIPVGEPGHAIVQIHIGGNDLQPFIFTSDDEAVSEFDPLIMDAAVDWGEVWDFFQDPANFPDGATVLVNTQYNPFDDCDATVLGFVSLSDVKTGLLHDYNTWVSGQTNAEPNGFVIDQHPSFLGHGHNYAQPQCASYVEGYQNWMIEGGLDLIHAGPGGHAGMAIVMRASVDRAYATEGCTG